MDAAKEEGLLGKAKAMMNQFNDPNGGGPDPNLIKVVMALVGGIILYKVFEFLYGKKKPTEITYQSFLQMMQQKRVSMITFTEDRGNSNFKYRAIIETNDGDETFFLTMPQVNNF